MIPLDIQNSLGSPSLLTRTDLTLVVLQLQFEGWQIAKEKFSEISPTSGEVFLNGCLFQGMKDARTAHKLFNLFIVEKPAVRSDPNMATPNKEPDLGLYFVDFGANYPHALIECKRLDPLETPPKLRGAYIRSGVDRFVDGSYGQGHDLDFMVAYVLRSDSPAAMTDINVYLAKVGRQDASLHPENGFAQTGFVAKSDHLRAINGADFALLHSFLEFDEPMI